LHADPDRLKRPVRRAGDAWVPLEWDEAFDLVGMRLAAVGAQHGDDAVAIYLGNRTVHDSGTLLASVGFLRELRTRPGVSANDLTDHERLDD